MFNLLVLKILIVLSLQVETIFEPEAEKNALVKDLGCANFKTGSMDSLVIFLISNK